MTMPELLAAVRARLAQQGHGATAAFARHPLISVTPQAAAAWLSDPPRRYPDGERTLALLEWLEQTRPR